MSRVGAAFVCFFKLLFKGELPPGAARFLPEEARPQLPPAQPEPATARPRPASRNDDELRSEGALTLLGLLQREGRLVDFLGETLDGYDDAAIGAAVRDIHRGCKKALFEHARLEPVMPGQEDSPVTVPRGFDPGQVRLIGHTNGQPPFKGTLIHHGWRALSLALPTVSDGVDRRVLAPAEVRLG